MIADAANVQRSGRKHVDAMKSYGASEALLDSHKALIGGVQVAFTARDKAGASVHALVARKHDAHEAAVDLVMAARRSAHAAFDAETEADAEARRACTIGEPPPRTQAALERNARSIAGAAGDSRWKKTLATYGFGAKEVAALEAAVKEAGAAESERTSASAAERAAAAALLEKLHALEHMTAKIRKIANNAFHKKPERKEFDRPVKTVKHKKKAGPAAVGKPAG
jgi:hypothetical protein